MLHKTTKLLFATTLFIICMPSYAFNKGQRVWIDIPAININDDAYAEGEVLQDKQLEKVKVYVKSITASQAFASGVSCTPDNVGVEKQPTDANVKLVATDLLPHREQLIPRTQLMNWTEGYNRYYERQNWLNIFLKWSDNHPVIERDQIRVTGEIVAARGMQALADVSQIILENYDAYQTEHFIFYPIPERLEKLTHVLQHIKTILHDRPELAAAWQPKPRNIDQVNLNSYTFFMTQAIDKIIANAVNSRSLYKGSPDAKIIAFDQALAALKR